ncbi:hypothetical protein BFG57_02845 [Bacillus solimangrovi]|uniref:ABC transmembrane type-1 domain-containing protein n=2 Tax=Bacillus solimangrovi TaxID=1305675 RepID=A0A1E5LDX9_9BACI|nr:hypothetical protein BFG57_02845 [Bacillus solimangrovi]
MILLLVLVLTSGIALYAGVAAFIQTTSSGVNVYQDLFANERFMKGLTFSIYVSVVSTFFALIVGVILTHFIYKFGLKKWGKAMMWLPMLFPHFVAGYLILLFFSQSGWISSIMYQLDLLNEMSSFPNLVYDRKGIGIILTYLWKEIPFVVLMLIPIYEQIDSRLEEVIRMEGGGKWHQFKDARWPFLWPFLVEIGVIIFAFMVGAFEVPYLLGATSPKMTAVLSFEWFYQGGWLKRPDALAGMFVISIIILVITMVVLGTTQKYRERVMRGS